MFFVGTCNEKSNVDATGQDSTQVIHPVHSTVLTVINLSTGIRDGQFLAHFPQSIQLSTFRRILNGENNEKCLTKRHKGTNNGTKHYE